MLALSLSYRSVAISSSLTLANLLLYSLSAIPASHFLALGEQDVLYNIRAVGGKCTSCDAGTLNAMNYSTAVDQSDYSISTIVYNNI